VSAFQAYLDEGQHFQHPRSVRGSDGGCPSTREKCGLVFRWRFAVLDRILAAGTRTVGIGRNVADLATIINIEELAAFDGPKIDDLQLIPLANTAGDP